MYWRQGRLTEKEGGAPAPLPLLKETAPAAQAVKVFPLAVIVLAIALLTAFFQPTPVGARSVFDSRWGEVGDTEGQFFWPIGVAADGAGNVYVADTFMSRVQRFDVDGTFKIMWGWGVNPDPPDGFEVCESSCQGGLPGSGDGQLSLPSGVTVDRDGKVYVSDSDDNDRIQVFRPPNEGHAYDTQWGGEGTGEGQFDEPAGIAVDAVGDVYVADSGNHRVQKFRPDGAGYVFVTAWGGFCDVAVQGQDGCDGQFNYPSGIAVDPDGGVFVADTYNSRIQRFDSGGGFMERWGSHCDVAVQGQDGCDGDFNRPHGIAVDPDGKVFVADTYNSRIQRFNSSGGFMEKWGGFCDVFLEGLDGCDGQFSNPHGIAVDASGNFYVADTVNYRVQKFRGLPPVNIVPPKVSGSPHVGQELECSEGEWDNEPTGFSYRWLRDGEDMGAASGPGYGLAGADAGHEISCAVTATNASGSATATSNGVGVPTPSLPAPPGTAPGPPDSPVSAPGSAPGSAPFSEACNLEITSPRPRKTGTKTMRVTARQARRLFTHGAKGTMKWGTVNGKDVVCKKVKMVILQQRGKHYYIPGTRTRVSKKILTRKRFSTRGVGFLKKKKVGKLRTKTRSGKRQTKISYKDFNRRSRLGERALNSLRRRGYIGKFLVVYSAEIDRTTVLKKIGLRSRVRVRF